MSTAPFIQNSGRARRLMAAIGLALSFLAPSAFAQTDSISIVPANSDTAVAATEKRLWLVVNLIEPESSGGVVFSRLPGRDFELINRLNTRIVKLAPFDDECILFMADRTIYHQVIGSPTLTAMRSLPGNGLPLDVADARNRLWALVDERTAQAIRDPAATTRPALNPPADNAHISIALLEREAWRILTECPAPLGRTAGAGLAPAILFDDEHLLVMSPDQDLQRLDYAWFDIAAQRWSAPAVLGPLETPPNAFWLVRVKGTPTLIISVAGEKGAELAAFRWLVDESRAGPQSWLKTTGAVSALPNHAPVSAFDHAFGFNQHFGVVARDAANKLYLCFGRPEGAPLEPTASISDAVSKPAQAIQYQGYFQLAMLVALGLVLALLFGLRRGSLSTPLVLPPGIAPALLLPRLGAAVIDFAPFGYAAARALDIPLREAFSTLADWTLQTDVTAPAARPVLIWWGLSCCGYVLYSLLMELLVRRTVGKVLLGMRVVAESGGRTGMLAIIVRNLLRLVELFPQFWVFAVLPLWSRNRQRLGDIFARTLVIRYVTAEDGEKPDQPPAV